MVLKNYSLYSFCSGANNKIKFKKSEKLVMLQNNLHLKSDMLIY